MSTLVEFEPLVDSTSKTFMKIVNDRFARTGEICPLDRWLQMYAFDIMLVSLSLHKACLWDPVNRH